MNIDKDNNELFNRMLVHSRAEGREESFVESGVQQQYSDDLSKWSAKVNDLWYVTPESTITTHRKGLLGKLIVIAKKALRKYMYRWYMTPIVDGQRQYNVAATNLMNELVQTAAQLKDVAHQQQTQLASLEQQLAQKDQEVTQLYASLDKLQQQKSQLEAQQDEQATAFSADLQQVRASIELLTGTMKDGLADVGSSFDRQFDSISSKVLHLKRQVENAKTRSIEPTVRSIATDGGESAPSVDTFRFDYFSFEERFRGSVDLVRERQSMYLPFFQGMQHVLDIGCGRGEFLELLVAHNISCSGIDLDQDMVDYCVEQGLDVRQMDLFDRLQQIQDGQLGGIFMSHVIEHLTPAQLVDFLDVAYAKLQPGAHLIMETPNPLSLYIFANAFYQDPTHVKPVHPGTLKFMVECAGFSEGRLEFLSPVDEANRIKKLQLDLPDTDPLAVINENFDKVDRLLFGYQDYVLIAKK